MTDFRDKKVGILGLGEENIALVRYLKNSGAKITVCDKKEKDELGDYLNQIQDIPVELKLGDFYIDNLKDFDVIFRTPGLPYFTEKIQKAIKSGVEVSSQTKLFFSLCPSPIIGVTGTKGKGTTASLISEILKSNSKIKIQNSKIYLGGNIGNPPISFLDKLTQNDIVVLELSSFQLQDLDKSPHVGVVLDIKVDHLDYHKSVTEYIEAKENIVRNQKKTDFAVLNADYKTSSELASITKADIFWFSRKKPVEKGAWVKDKKEFILSVDKEKFFIGRTDDVTLRGEHNLENICAAITSSHLAGADIESIKKVVRSFQGLEHRLELINEINGISYYNDSFSTTPDTTIAAINSFHEPIILLIGGSSKKADFENLGKVIENSSIKIIINIGETGKEIINNIKNTSNIEILEKIHTLNEGIAEAKKYAKKGDVILLSPASASFDHFKNYKERGKLFKIEVMKK